MLDKIESRLDRTPESDVSDGLNKVEFMAAYRNKVGLIAIAVLFAFLSQVIFYVMAKKMDPPELYFVAQNGSLSGMVAMTYPNQSREAVKDWAKEAVQKSFTFDFLKIDSQLLSAEPYFTSDAWALFKNSMLGSSLVKMIKKNKFTVSVVAREDPIIENAAKEKGAEFAWKLLIPVTMSFSGDAATKTQDMLMRVTVIRVPTTENPKGLGILQMVSGELPITVGGK